MSEHIMLDLETLGTRTGSVILSIGAVKFDPVLDSSADDFEVFHEHLDFNEQTRVGMSIDAGTVQWWMQQDANARQEFSLQLKRTAVKNALLAFTKFAAKADALWANAPTFDCSLLRHLYDVYGLEFPVKFYKELCMRTLKWQVDYFGLKGVGDSKWGTKHNALDDAIGQAMYVQRVLGKLRAA